VRGICTSVCIAPSVSAEKRYETNISVKSYIQMYHKGSNDGSVEGSSVETATTDEDLHHFPIDTLPQLLEDASLQTRLHVVHAQRRYILFQHSQNIFI
jgi:hypothetical protein